ncbi:MAG: hypothetical protein CME05_06155 [Gemmatimonadaceae bacterium]|nr:hypothetical protein [Gemmatimonadaceae bacterium]
MRFLILTVYENHEYALRAARLGASGYLMKNVFPPGSVQRDTTDSRRRNDLPPFAGSTDRYRTRRSACRRRGPESESTTA